MYARYAFNVNAKQSQIRYGLNRRARLPFKSISVLTATTIMAISSRRARRVLNVNNGTQHKFNARPRSRIFRTLGRANSKYSVNAYSAYRIGQTILNT